MTGLSPLVDPPRGPAPASRGARRLRTAIARASAQLPVDA